MNLPINIVTGNTSPHTKTSWQECSDVLNSLYKGLLLDHTRLFVLWDVHLASLLHRTLQYSESTVGEDTELVVQWKSLLGKLLVDGS